VDELEKLDLDALRALTEILRDSGATKFRLGNMYLEFPPAEQEHPKSSVVESPKPDARSGYVKLLGQLPSWPKAS